VAIHVWQMNHSNHFSVHSTSESVLVALERPRSLAKLESGYRYFNTHESVATGRRSEKGSISFAKSIVPTALDLNIVDTASADKGAHLGGE